jgi:hypothetical protein
MHQSKKSDLKQSGGALNLTNQFGIAELFS